MTSLDNLVGLPEPSGEARLDGAIRQGLQHTAEHKSLGAYSHSDMAVCHLWTVWVSSQSPLAKNESFTFAESHVLQPPL